MKNKRKKRPKIKWSDEQMRMIMELRRSSAAQRHANKRAYRRREKFNKGDHD